MKTYKLTLTEAVNNWAQDKLSVEEFAAFYVFVYNKWNSVKDKSKMNLDNEYRVFKAGA